VHAVLGHLQKLVHVKLEGIVDHLAEAFALPIQCSRNHVRCSHGEGRDVDWFQNSLVARVIKRLARVVNWIAISVFRIESEARFSARSTSLSSMSVSVGRVDNTNEGGALVESQDSVSAPSTHMQVRA
jgi:hypothetical protein